MIFITSFWAIPDGYHVNVGDGLVEEYLGNSFIVLEKKRFSVDFSQALTASQKVSGVQVTELKSSESEMYWIDSIQLINDVKFWMRFRDRELFGTNVTSYLTQDHANLVEPFEMNKWMYNFTPVADIEENAALAVTAKVRFNGIIFSVRKLNPDNPKDRDMYKCQLGQMDCRKVWYVRG